MSDIYALTILSKHVYSRYDWNSGIFDGPIKVSLKLQQKSRGIAEIFERQI